MHVDAHRGQLFDGSVDVRGVASESVELSYEERITFVQPIQEISKNLGTPPPGRCQKWFP